MRKKMVSKNDKDDAPYMNFNLKLLAMTGVWYDRGIIGRVSWFTLYLFFMYILIFFGSILEIYVFIDNIPIMTEALSGLMTYSTSFHKLVTLILFEKELKYLVHVAKRNFYSYEQRRIPEQNEILLKRDRQVRILTYCFAAFLFITGTFLNLFPVAEGLYHINDVNSTYEWRFPSRLLIPIDTSTTYMYWLMYAFHCTIGWLHVLVMPACDNFFIALMNQACGQLFILRYNLEHFYETAVKKAERNGQLGLMGAFLGIRIGSGKTEIISLDGSMVSDFGNHDDGKSQPKIDTLAIMDDTFNTEMESQLKEYIKHHKIIVKYVERLEAVLNQPMFSQFISSTIVICTAAFQIAVFPTDAVKSIGMAGFLISEIVQLGMYCYYADIIMEQTDLVGYSAYFSQWYITPEKVKRCIMVIMARSQKSTLFTVGKFFELSLGTFGMILKYSYTYLMLLYELHE